MPTDKERLDHLARRGLLSKMLPGHLKVLWNGKGKTLREAIDTAIRAERKASGKGEGI